MAAINKAWPTNRKTFVFNFQTRVLQSTASAEQCLEHFPVRVRTTTGWIPLLPAIVAEPQGGCHEGGICPLAQIPGGTQYSFSGIEHKLIQVVWPAWL